MTEFLQSLQLTENREKKYADELRENYMQNTIPLGRCCSIRGNRLFELCSDRIVSSMRNPERKQPNM